MNEAGSGDGGDSGDGDGEDGKEEKKSRKSTLMMSYAPHTTKQRISKEEQEAVEQWLKDTCPKQSGSKYYFQRCSHTELYQQYTQAMKEGKVQWKGMEEKQEARCGSKHDACDVRGDGVGGEYVAGRRRRRPAVGT